MCTVPATTDAGLVVVMWLSSTTVKVAATPPKLTDVVPVKAVPVSVTAVPPVIGPVVVLTPVTEGTVAAEADRVVAAKSATTMMIAAMPRRGRRAILGTASRGS